MHLNIVVRRAERAGARELQGALVDIDIARASIRSGQRQRAGTFLAQSRGAREHAAQRKLRCRRVDLKYGDGPHEREFFRAGRGWACVFERAVERDRRRAITRAVHSRSRC